MCRPAFPLSPRALFNDEQCNESFALTVCIRSSRPVCAWPCVFSGSKGPGAPDPSLVHVFLLQPSCDSGWQTDFSCAGLQRATGSAANSVLTCCSIREQAGQEVMPSADVLVDPTVALVLGAFGSLDGSGPWRM